MKRFRSPSPVEKKRRFSIGLNESLYNAALAEAQKRRWSLAALCEYLIEEKLGSASAVKPAQIVSLESTIEDSVKPPRRKRGVEPA